MKSNVWLLAVSLTLGALICGGTDWLSALVGCAVGFLLYYIYKKTNRPAPGWCRILQGIWAILLLAVLGQKANALFPDAANPYYIPAILLALSWLCARTGENRLFACNTVLSYFVWAAVGIVGLCAIGQLEWQWTVPSFGWEGVILGFSLGAGAMLLPGKADLRWCIASAIVPSVLALLVSGTLSPGLAKEQSLAFYTLSRSIRLFGVVERFEALVAAGLCIGLFGVMTAIMNGIRTGLKPQKADAVTLLAGCFSTLLTGRIRDVVVLGGTAGVLYVILPFFQKKRKKALTDGENRGNICERSREPLQNLKSFQKNEKSS